MHVIPELVTHVTRFLTASETGIASRTCKTWYNNAYWTSDEVVERFQEATAQRNIALRDAIMERYTLLYPRLLKAAIRAGCSATTERLMAVVPASEVDVTSLLEWCDLTYAFWANTPGELSRLRNAPSNAFPGTSIGSLLWDRTPEKDPVREFLQDLDDEHAELIANIKSRQASLVKFLLAKKAVPPSKLLHQAVKSGFEEVVRLLLRDGRVVPLRLDILVVEASENKDPAVLCLLLQGGCKVTDECFNRAIRGGSCQAVEVLLQFSRTAGDANVWEENHDVFLSEAAKYGQLAIVRRLLQEECVRVHQWTITSAVCGGSVSVVEVLVECWEKEHCARYRFGCDDLQMACVSQNVAMVHMVFSSEYERDEFTADECLDKLMWHGWDTQRKEEIVRYLFGHRTFVSTLSMNQCQKLLLRVTEEGAVELVKMVLRLPCFSEGSNRLRLCEKVLQTPLCHTDMVSKIQEWYWPNVLFFQALCEVDLPWCSEKPKPFYNYN